MMRRKVAVAGLGARKRANAQAQQRSGAGGMTDLVEAMARAARPELWEYRDQPVDTLTQEAYHIAVKNRWVENVRNVFAALEAAGWVVVPREPTEAMLSAHHVVPDDNDFTDRALSNWRALIVAAPKVGGGVTPHAR